MHMLNACLHAGTAKYRPSVYGKANDAYDTSRGIGANSAHKQALVACFRGRHCREMMSARMLSRMSSPNITPESH